MRLKEKMIHYPQSERGTKTACHLLIAYAPLRWRSESDKGPGEPQSQQRERDSKQRKARGSPCIGATISLEAQVTLPTSPLTPQRGGRGNLRAERKVGKMRRKRNNEWKEGAACFTALV